ncbi:MAG TPA: hypothetical protein GX401_09090 [Clostridiales bacterium]|nr:hypothetical protein [Clostridiales bacterium]
MTLSQKGSFFNRVLLNVSLFRVVYIVTLFLCSFYFVGTLAVVLKYVLMIWGIQIVFFYYIKARRIYNVLYSRWLIAFVGASFLTAVLHVVDNFLPNMVMLAHVIICFFIFYGMHTERNQKRVKKEIYNIAMFIVFACTITAVIGIAMIFITGKIRIDQLNYDIVVYENRFTGLYTNPNLLGFYSVVAIFCTHMLTKKDFLKECGHKRPSKILLISSLSVNVIALFLCDSNGSLLLLTMYVFGNLIYKLFGGLQHLTIGGIFKKVLILVVCLMVIGSSFLVIRWGANQGFSTVVKNHEMAFQTPQSASTDIKEPSISFEHINKNLDSGRIELLTEAVVLFGNYPLLGIGKENLIDYGNRYIDGGLHFSDLHNGYLTILVCAGIIGFVIFVGFAIHVARHAVKSLFLEKKNLSNSIFPCLFAFIVAYCVYAAFEKTLLYEQTYMVVMFWLVLGYMSCYMVKFNHINDKFDITGLFKKKDKQGTKFTLDDADIEAEDDAAIIDENNTQAIMKIQ